MIPLKYGVGYQPRLLDQGVAYVVAYATDGSVMLQHGGAESGQGIDTKMMQRCIELSRVAAKEGEFPTCRRKNSAPPPDQPQAPPRSGRPWDVS